MKVLITTSGLGTRIADYTKYINKSLVSIQDKPVISHIIDSYPKDSSFVVTIGYLGDLVKQFLEICYPDRDIVFVEVDKFSGDGSSLLYSITCAREFLQEPFIFHACDTVLSESSTLEDNWIGCGRSLIQQSCYRTVNVNKNYITSINDKGDINYDYDFVGVFGVKDYELFWSISDFVLSNNKEPSDYHVLRDMIKHVKFKCKVFSNWLDAGNIASLQTAKTTKPSTFNVLPKEKESIFFVQNKVIKFFYDDTVCSNRIRRSDMLKGLVPKIDKFTKNFYSYLFCDGQLLSKVADENNIKSLLSWSVDNLWKPKTNESFDKECLRFYKDKTIDRINLFLENNNIKDDVDLINGIKVPAIFELLETIDFKSISKNHSRCAIYHGDFVLDNILINDLNDFTLIDWRQNFGSVLDFGDMLYDLAKLNHSMYLNHDILMKNLFTIDCDKDIFVDIMISKRLLDCKNVLINFCEENNISMRIINILTSLIWINMAPLHHYPLNKFLYYFGKLHLYRSINNA